MSLYMLSVTSTGPGAALSVQSLAAPCSPWSQCPSAGSGTFKPNPKLATKAFGLLWTKGLPNQGGFCPHDYHLRCQFQLA